MSVVVDEVSGRILYADDGFPIPAYPACRCSAGCRPAEDHDPRCLGSRPVHWRTRVPDFLQDEVTRIYLRVPRAEAPIFRALALEYLTTARYGPPGDTR